MIGLASAPVRGNDWRRVAVPTIGAFRPELPVSVIVPYYRQPEELGRTLAALERQTFPCELFEVVVVDDGSPEPLTAGASWIERAPFAVRVVWQEDRGFGLARARNTGARAAAHDILLFLDADLLPEADWLTAHARWHHAVPDALTPGPRAHVSVDGLDAEAIRACPLGELLAERKVDRVEQEWWESHLRRTDDLTSNADDLFRLIGGGNLGIRRGFFELVGGFDESFTEWGGEDTEFGYRAFARGGLLVPVRDGFTWHQGPWEEGRGEKDRSRADGAGKLAHRIAHASYRTERTGRLYETPEFVVTIPGGGVPQGPLLWAVEQVLGDSAHDLVVRLELPRDHAGRAWFDLQFGPDPRVRVAPSRPALEEFPASPFQVTLPAERPLPRDAVRRLREALGAAVLARCVFPDGSEASITRSWALHRALRTPWQPADFGEVVTISREEWEGPVVGEAPAPRRSFPLGVEIATLGARSRAVLAASGRVGWTLTGQQVEVVLADTSAEAAGVEAPVVVLEESPHQLSVPAFDPGVHNPIGCAGNRREGVGALGPPARLPPGSEADREVRGDDRKALRQLRWLEDVAAFHPDPAARAGELVRLAATGIVVHLADGGPELEPYLGAELFALMTSEVRGLDAAGREELSVRMRRVALREHSLGSRARQVAERVLPDPPWLPLVSLLVATRRPGFLPRVLATVREQHYPRLELILALHGEGFGEVGAEAAGPSVPLTVLRLDGALPLGSVLNLAARAASGTLLTRLDDDAVYGPDHLWDLVLAHEYSRAPLVAKPSAFLWLGASDRTIRYPMGAAERFGADDLRGAAVLLTCSAFDRLGGWERSDLAEDPFLLRAAARAGLHSYATHPYGFLTIPRGLPTGEAHYLALAEVDLPGWRPDLAGLGGAPSPAVFEEPS